MDSTNTEEGRCGFLGTTVLSLPIIYLSFLHSKCFHMSYTALICITVTHTISSNPLLRLIYFNRIAKHLVCQDCCKDGTISVDPWEKIVYPDQTERPILTVKEFCKEGMNKIDYKRYCYVRGSYTDYTAKAVNEGNPLYGQAGGFFKAELLTMISDEYD